MREECNSVLSTPTELRLMKSTSLADTDKTQMLARNNIGLSLNVTIDS